jgi:hypothetical protein
VPSPSSFLSSNLLRRFRFLDSTRVKVEALFNSGDLSKKDIDRVYEGLFLSINATFEQFIDDLFIGLLVNGVGLQTARRDIVQRITVRSYRVAREIVYGSPRRRYVTWIPYENTIELANIYFQGGRPFTDLSQVQKQTLQNCHLIRDAIAHKSRFSTERFQTIILGGINVPISERHPAGYLKGVFRINPPQSRYENFASELAIISYFLAK